MLDIYNIKKQVDEYKEKISVFKIEGLAVDNWTKKTLYYLQNKSWITQEGKEKR